MPIFARKKEEVPEIPEKIPEVPTAEELKQIARRLAESLKSMGKPKELEELRKVAKVLEEKPEVKVEVKEEPEKEAPKPEVEKKEAPPEEEAIPAPPLFIKLERYYRLLRHLSELKRTLTTTKLTISTLAEIDKMREENIKLLQKAIEGIDKKLAALDAELLRPRTLPERLKEVEITGVEGVVGDLKSQLESLREELESIA